MPSISATPQPKQLTQYNVIPSTRRQAHIELNRPTDRIHFGAANSTQQTSIEEEADRLAQELPTGLLGRLIPLQQATMLARAQFNLTEDPAALHALLPYRKKLADSNSPALKQYDALVEKIMDTAEFYQAPSNKAFREKLRPLYHNQTQRSVFYPIYNFLKKLSIIVRRLFSSSQNFRSYKLERAREMLKQSKKIDNQALKQLAQNTKPLQDKSTRYFIAAGIAELLHQHPEYADRVLNPQHQRPLRFVVSNEKSGSILGGQVNLGSNVIWLYQQALWFAAQNNRIGPTRNIAQHEFIHALSEGSELDTLPMMNKSQVKRFKTARTKLFQQFDTQDNTWSAWYKTITNPKHKPSTGIRGYGFTDDLEFLTVSLDTFKYDPEALYKTPAGKDLYNLYQELFGIDPLNDIKHTETDLDLSTLYKILQETESKNNSPA